MIRSYVVVNIMTRFAFVFVAIGKQLLYQHVINTKKFILVQSATIKPSIRSRQYRCM